MSTAERASTRLLCATDRCSTLVHWPIAVNHRLDQLQELAVRAGTHVSRSQILAALVMATELDGERIAEIVRSYRVLESDSTEYSESSRRRPGPRKIR